MLVSTSCQPFKYQNIGARTNKSLVLGLEIQFSGTAFAKHVEGPVFDT